MFQVTKHSNNTNTQTKTSGVTDPSEAPFPALPPEAPSP